MNTAVVSAAMIYMLLKQYYSDKWSIPKKLAQSVCESRFQSVPRFSHVRWIIVAAFQFRFMALAIDIIDRCGPSNEMRRKLQL